MVFQIGGSPFGAPSRPPTHAPVPMDALLHLARGIRAKSADGMFTVGAADDVAAECGVPTSHVFVAAAVMGLRTREEFEHRFVVCAGRCQGWGALERIELLLRSRKERIEAGRPAFDIEARQCLDGCSRAPFIAVRTPDGVGALPDATDEDVARMIGELLAEA